MISLTMRRLTGLPAASRLTALVCAVCGLAAAIVVGALVVLAHRPLPPADRLIVVGALCAVGNVTLFHLRYGHNKESYTWSEAVIVISVAVAPVAWVIAIMAASAVVYYRMVNHVWTKALFNASILTISTAAAGLILAAGGQRWGDALSPRGAGALTLAVMVCAGCQWVAVGAAVALSQDVPITTICRTAWQPRLVMNAGNLFSALGVLAMAAWNPSALIVLPPMVVLLLLVYRGYLRAITERNTWRELEEATRELSRLDEDDVTTVALTRAAQLLRADAARLVLGSGADQRRLEYRATDGALDMHGTLELEGVTTWTEAPLAGPKGSIGRLCAGFRGTVVLSQREQQVLTTFAHTLSTTLENARLYAEMREEARRQAHEATHDKLTGLGNRALLHEAAPAAFASTTSDQLCALLLLDLDHFKQINDTLGHPAGDLLLRQVGERLSRGVRVGEIVVRLGGDEFAVLLPGLADAAETETRGAVLLATLAEPLVLDGLQLSIEGSMGVACYPVDGASVEELLQRADIAMYQAKTTPGSQRRYSSQHDDSNVDRLALVAELRTAIERRELVVHYQVQVDLHTGRPTGAEALVRWDHPRRGVLPPAEFVPVAEHSGLVRAFTLYVLDRAVSECAGWTVIDDELSVAVNLSARSLLDRELPTDVATVLLRHGLPAHRLVLEITETMMMSELDVVEEVLSELRRMGVQLSVDDFGTGYSSLAFLQRVAVNEIKIDRSFVSTMLAKPSDAAIVQAMVQLARSLGLRIVCEGVETEALREAVSAAGCDVAQGYWLGRPVPAREVGTLLATGPVPRASIAAPPSDPAAATAKAAAGHPVSRARGG